MNEQTVLITGGTGMLGNAFKDIKTKFKLVLVGSSDYNLFNYSETCKMFQNVNPDMCIHLAAKVGGVKANTDYIADFCADNLLINHNVLKSANEVGVEKVLSLLSTCVYPDKATYPLTEDQIHSGVPHFSNFGYAHAKRMLDVQSRAYRSQYGRNYITAIPNNMFGEYDNFDLNNSHVIPAIIRKMYEAKIKNQNVTLWGDGTPLREFTYSKDIANILLFVLEKYNGELPVNIGNTKEYTIKFVAETIANILNFNGNIIWDTKKLSGQHKKPSDNSKLIELGFKNVDYTQFVTSLSNTCKWFVNNYPKVRGVIL